MICLASLTSPFSVTILILSPLPGISKLSCLGDKFSNFSQEEKLLMEEGFHFHLNPMQEK